MSSKPQRKFSDRLITSREKETWICCEIRLWSSFYGRSMKRGEKKNHSCVCVAETVLYTLFINIMIIIIILISSSVGDVSKLPSDGDLFWLVLLQ